jgi:hypothetical protein
MAEYVRVERDKIVHAEQWLADDPGSLERIRNLLSDMEDGQVSACPVTDPAGRQILLILDPKEPQLPAEKDWKAYRALRDRQYLMYEESMLYLQPCDEDKFEQRYALRSDVPSGICASEHAS